MVVKSYRDLRVYKMLDFALECGYIPATIHQELRANYDHIGAMLTKMINDADKWCNKI